MLKRFRCPYCQKTIETDQGAGVKIDCPYCEEAFEIRAADEVRPNPAREMAFRLAIPIGYVLFVAVPLALTIWFFVNRAERQEREAREAAEAAEVKVARDDRPPAPRPAPRRKKDAAPDADGAKPFTDEKPEAKSEPTPEVKRTDVASPEAKAAEAVVAEVEVAPPPREIVWKLPPMDYVSPWQTVGAVELRVAGVAVAPVPLIDGKDRVRDSARPMLVVVIEVRMNTSTKKRQFGVWAHPGGRRAAGFLAGGRDLPGPDLPLGTKVRSGVPLVQPITADGRPAYDIVVFEAPPDGSGTLSLRLDGDRVGETADIWFKIPPSAWKK